MARHRSVQWFHGGRRVHDWSQLTWDRDRFVASGNAEGPGMYWTTDVDEANRYLDRGSEPMLYQATERPGFKRLAGKPTLAFLRGLYEGADPDDQAVFLSNWGYEHPAPWSLVDQALKPYTHQTSALDAAVTLYHDLFRHDANVYVATLRGLGFDGATVPRGGDGGSNRRDHLVLWNVRALDITEGW